MTFFYSLRNFCRAFLDAGSLDSLILADEVLLPISCEGFRQVKRGNVDVSRPYCIVNGFGAYHGFSGVLVEKLCFSHTRINRTLFIADFADKPVDKGITV